VPIGLALGLRQGLDRISFVNYRSVGVPGSESNDPGGRQGPPPGRVGRSLAHRARVRGAVVVGNKDPRSCQAIKYLPVRTALTGGAR
jgi:hypothetical protein